MSDLPLSGYRVLELAHLVAGPLCGMYLADMGADVVKVEAPGSGDALRYTYGLRPDDDDPPFLVVNRNKRSAALDLGRPEGVAAFRRLAARADVVIEGYRGGVAERLGIGYGHLAPSNPRLIYCSVSAFGPAGPWRDKPGVDMLIQAMSGLMSLTGEPDGPPAIIGAPLVDTIGALLACQGVLTALLHRERTGQGQRVDVSLLEGGLLGQAARLPLYWSSGRDVGRHGSAHARLTPFQAFQASDGWVYVAVWTDRMWRPFCRALGLDDLAEDPGLATTEGRFARRAEIVARAQPVFRRRTVAAWMAVLEAADVLCAPVNTHADLDRDPQVQALGAIVEQEHPRHGRIRTLAPPVRFEKTPGSIRTPAPALGEHTEAVLREAGLTAQEVQTLRRSGVLG